MRALMKSIKITPRQKDAEGMTKKRKMAVMQFEVPMDSEEQSEDVYAVQDLMDEEVVEIHVLPFQLRLHTKGGETNEQETEGDSESEPDDSANSSSDAESGSESSAVESAEAIDLERKVGNSV